jgi:hypothetical protein
MSEDTTEAETVTLIGSWVRFEELRKEMEAKVKGLELSSFNMNFGDAKSEKAFRQRLSEIQTLLDKILRLLGPETTEAKTVV